MDVIEGAKPISSQFAAAAGLLTMLLEHRTVKRMHIQRP